MFYQELIRQKRDGTPLSSEEIHAFVQGLTDGSMTDAQAAALAMAIFFKGMTVQERTDLTLAMANSGRRLDWSTSGLDGPILDKHSTGGVGDKVSLILAPVIAACGGYVPMISGRGLGHTGGTLDKLDSIPGYQSRPDNALLIRAVRNAGCAIVGATADLAPADARLYAIRDTTGTIESLDLITSSILSKKMAASLDGLVMDVKFGNGAFIPGVQDALSLANSIAAVANAGALPTVALLTDMNQVLGRTAGNALEVAEALSVLRGEVGDGRLWNVTRALAGELLALGNLAADAGTGESLAQSALNSGAAAERFSRMCAELGGPMDILDVPDRHLVAAPVHRPVLPDTEGVVTAIDTRSLGIAVLQLGGGRHKPEDGIDHRVGLAEMAGIGEKVSPKGRPLGLVHAADQSTADAVEAVVKAAYTLGESGTPGPLIARRLP